MRIDYLESDVKRIAAVNEYINQVLINGRSKINPTLLLADGINTFDGSHAFWPMPDGSKPVISDYANQQNFMRTLVAYSKVTGDHTYYEEAKKITSYFINQYQNENGLFYWGGHVFVDLDTLETNGPEDKGKVHELKVHFPFYDLMIEVNSGAMEKYLKQLWVAHVYDWNTLDFNRHGDYNLKIKDDSNIDIISVPKKNIVDDSVIVNFEKKDETGQDHLYKGLILPRSNGLTFLKAGVELYYAAYELSHLNRSDNPRKWGKFLIDQYHYARNPETNLPVYLFTQPRQRLDLTNVPDTVTLSMYGDRAQRQFGKVFGPAALEGNALFKNLNPILVDQVMMNLYLGQKYNDVELINRTISMVKNYYSQALTQDSQGNYKLLPMWNDGQCIKDFELYQDGYYGKKGTIITLINLNDEFMLTLARCAMFAPTDDELWELLRKIVKQQGYGDLGTKEGMNFNLVELNNPSAQSLFMFVELYNSTNRIEYLEIARKIGDTIVKQRFHRGYFVPSKNHIYCHISNADSLALIALDALIKGCLNEIPIYFNETGYVHGDYLDLETGILRNGQDNNFIYNQLIK